MNDIEPFLTQAPEHIYKNFTSTKEAMYGFTNAVRSNTGMDELNRKFIFWNFCLSGILFDCSRCDVDS